MPVRMEIRYEGNLYCQATHGPSGSILLTEAPVDNGGKGEAFSPTDLVATALGTCILTIMGIVADRQGLDIRGTVIQAEKEMVKEPVRRIGALRLRVVFPSTLYLSEADRQRFENAAATCPVKRSLHPDVQVSIEYQYA